MIKNIIFDYMGVIAGVDIKLMLKNLTLTEKTKVLRILVGMKRYPIFREAFDAYQMGTVDKNDLYKIEMDVYPKAAPILPKFLELITHCLKENKSVLALAKKLHNDGFKVILLSNSIPETQAKIENSDMLNYFDGLVLSHHIGMIKPSKKIYEFTCETFGLDPEKTIMIDDTKENLVGAKEANLKTMHCNKPTSLAKRLGNMFYSNYEIEPNK